MHRQLNIFLLYILNNKREFTFNPFLGLDMRQPSWTLIGTFRIEEVLEHCIDPLRGKQLWRKKQFRPEVEKEYMGHKVKMFSWRYWLFKNKGVKCVLCGETGTYFNLEIPVGSERPHFNLYSAKGVLITKDHIVSKNKGGRDSLNNLQVMCDPCNHLKGNMK